MSSENAFRRLYPLFFAFLVVLIAATRFRLLDIVYFHHDEVWSVWQGIGTPAQIIERTPFDWAPLFYLLVGQWELVSGLNPIPIRVMSVLLFLLTLAILYRVSLRIFGRDRRGAALIALIGYSAVGTGIYQSVIARGYVLLVFLLVLLFWLTLRYFYRPTPLRALWPGLCIAALIYTQLTFVFACAVVGFYTLIAYPRKIWLWIGPGVVGFIIALPGIIYELHISQTIGTGVSALPFAVTMSDLFNDFLGTASWLWAILFGVTLLAFVRAVVARQGKFSLPQVRVNALTLGLWIIAPAGLYFITPLMQHLLEPNEHYFQPRYFWWLLPAIGLWLGWWLSTLPKAITVLSCAALIVAMVLPLPVRYLDHDVPFMENFKLLSKEAGWGDVILIDPYWRDAMENYMWDYYLRVYFPQGIHVVTNPDGYRRVWYVSKAWEQDPTIAAAVNKNRIPGKFFGPPDLLFRLYEAPPDVQGILFDNGMRFHGAEIVNAPTPDVPSFNIGDTLHVRLWWSADQQVKFDYSVGLYVPDIRPSNMGQTLVQVDGAPQVTDAPGQTSQWVTGRYYVDERVIQLPTTISNGYYSIQMAVYTYWDGKRAAAPGEDSRSELPIATFFIKSWRSPLS